VLFSLVLALGVVNAVAQPSRLALIPTLVDREALASAVAINSIVFNLARFIGPAVAGILIARVGVAAAFAANAVSYIAFQIALANLRDMPKLPPLPRQNALRASLDAYTYAGRHPGIGPMLLLFIVTTIGTRGFVELFPGFADGVFHRGAAGLAMLTSTVGIGAIFGGTWMLLRPALTGLTNVVLIATVLMSVAVLAFTASSSFYIALPCVFIAGSAMTITGTGAQTLIQASVDARMRGRVMALYGMIFRAGPAVGAVIMGSLSEHFGLRWPLAIGAMVSCAVWVMARMKQRQIAASLEDGADAGPRELVPAPVKPGA
jgi:predicted MFS family arabinose efflux permease